MSSTPLVLKIAAPFTRMSTPPKASFARSIADLTCASLVTSHVMGIARPPLLMMPRAQSDAFSALTSTQTTAAPSAAISSAIPPPMFELVPVITATLPSSFFIFQAPRSVVARRADAMPTTTNRQTEQFSESPLERHWCAPAKLNSGATHAVGPAMRKHFDELNTHVLTNSV